MFHCSFVPDVTIFCSKTGCNFQPGAEMKPNIVVVINITNCLKNHFIHNCIVLDKVNSTDNKCRYIYLYVLPEIASFLRNAAEV